MSRIQQISLCFALIFNLAIFELVRRDRLSARYSLLWFSTGLAIIPFAIFPRLLILLAQGLGVKYEPSAIFLLSIAFLVCLTLYLFLVVTRLTHQVRRLAQELALLRTDRSGKEN